MWCLDALLLLWIKIHHNMQCSVANKGQFLYCQQQSHAAVAAAAADPIKTNKEKTLANKVKQQKINKAQSEQKENKIQC